MNGPRVPSCLALALILSALPAVSSCTKSREPRPGKQVIMLGFDGMDPKLCGQALAEGLMPNFAKLAEQGSFKPLGTSTPPQSPVAWSTIITGTNPGEHGIFDFIHRDPKTYTPEFSTSRNESGWSLPVGHWVIPLKGGRVVNLRHGPPFWEFLTSAGVNAHVYRIPANYPPQPAAGPGEFLTLTDMGTPDLVGTVGQFSFYTTGPFEGNRDLSGGDVYRLRMKLMGGNVAQGSFYGPPDLLINPAKVGSEKAQQPVEAPFTIFRDPASRSAVIEWQDTRVLLREREWSDWRIVKFDMGPSISGVHPESVTGLVRLYLRQVLPTIELYASPIQINPQDPMLPVSVPADFATQVASEIGPYYTQGLPEDTQALRHSILTRDEFLRQAELIYQERIELLDFALKRFHEGFLFFYFGSTDQVGHMFWSAMADDHPAISPEERAKYGHVMKDLYAKVDKVVGEVQARFPDATILCISDHGFADFARGFNLNTWLVANGYAVLRQGVIDRSKPLSIDCGRSKAYGIGINGLYVNLKGRERDGIVEPAAKQALMDEISAKLLEVRDPKNGAAVIKEVYQAHKVYSGSQVEHGPDMQIGYSLGYRASWSTALGGASKELLEDNTEAWCSDHCIATDLVPGVVFTNKPVRLENPTIEDLAPTILDEFGITPPPTMHGRSLFEKRSG